MLKYNATMSKSSGTKRYSHHEFFSCYQEILTVSSPRGGEGKAVNKMNATRRKSSGTKRYSHREFSSWYQKILTVSSPRGGGGVCE